MHFRLENAPGAPLAFRFTADERLLLGGLLLPGERPLALMRGGGARLARTWVATSRRIVFLERSDRVYRVDDLPYARLDTLRAFHEPQGSRIRLLAGRIIHGLDGLPGQVVRRFEAAVRGRLAERRLRFA
jgi:hypothetical protein